MEKFACWLFNNISSGLMLLEGPDIQLGAIGGKEIANGLSLVQIEERFDYVSGLLDVVYFFLPSMLDSRFIVCGRSLSCHFRSFLDSGS